MDGPESSVSKTSEGEGDIVGEDCDRSRSGHSIPGYTAPCIVAIAMACARAQYCL